MSTISPDRERDTAFEREALPWLDDVHRFALSLTRDESDAEDVVQETYLRAYRWWHTFQSGSDCRRWLFTICRNAFLRTRERAVARAEVEDGDAEALAGVLLHSQLLRSGEDRLISQLELGPALERALEQLAEPFRTTVLLVDVEDQSYDAASEILGVPIGTVRSRLFRGRRLLQQQLLDFARDAGLTVPGSETSTGDTR